MRPTPKPSGVASGFAAPGHTAQPGTGPFMLTLCRLTAPVAIRPPQSPQLKPYTFFMSRFRQPDGGEQLHLHMGYFPTLEDARKWGQLLRKTYPEAVAMLAPAAHLRQRDSGVPTLAPADKAHTVVHLSRERPPVDDASLTDTQVLRVLEVRRAVSTEVVVEETAGVSLVRPEDTNTRRILREAVVQGAPVSFVVQLQWSVQPIDLGTVPSLQIFRAYRLYVTEGRRDGRSWHCLRLGFFSDVISAKQVAYHVRSSFASVAVVPIGEQERTRANDSRIGASALAAPAHLSSTAS